MATWPTDSVRTKNWGTEILTDADLEAQIDLLHSYFQACLNATTGHAHDGTLNQGPKLSPANFVIASQATGDLLYASSATAWARLGVGTANQQLRTNAGATAPEWFTPTVVSPPSGSITMWGGAIASPPTGWLICDGSAVSQATYAALYAILGTIYGSNAGGNFTLPNFTNKFPYGANEGSSAGNASVGSSKLRDTELLGNDSSVTMPFRTTASFTGGGAGEAPSPTNQDLMAPYLAISFIIKT